MTEGRRRVLVVFVDALGPRQVDLFGRGLAGVPHRRSLRGILGYTSGALPSILTGVTPAEHGRMCLFSRSATGRPGVLAPLAWLGLLPRLLHERQAFRRVLGRLFAEATGNTGYVALHRVPPAAFRWLDLPEREDLFAAERIGPAATFLAEARQAGLKVYAAPWQLPEEQRWAHVEENLSSDPPDLAFLFAPQMDAALHEHGNDHPRIREVATRISDRISRAHELMGRGSPGLLTLVLGDHGMADVSEVVDPRPIMRSVKTARVFVDSTMLRFWGDAGALAQAREETERMGFPGAWLGREELVSREAPTQGAPFGHAMFVLPEGALFAPSFVGGRLKGMHGYDLGSESVLATVASDHDLPEDLAALTDVAGVVRRHLRLSG